MDADTDKTIFVISPIGAEGSPQRIAADQLLRHVISPVATSLKYGVQRADKLDSPGTISTQIIRYLIEAPLVIADMTGHNPNVFYELAIRHAAKKPVVHMIQDGEVIPFDVAPTRAIMYSLNLDGAEEARRVLERQARSALDDEGEPDTPLSNALQRIALAQSPEPAERFDSKILDILDDMRLRLKNVEAQMGGVSTVEMVRARNSADQMIGWWQETIVFFKYVESVLKRQPSEEVAAQAATVLRETSMLLTTLRESSSIPLKSASAIESISSIDLPVLLYSFTNGAEGTPF